jgi:peptidoglycan/xylan/chitin deacetylase (PgdA/CDA1 family)
MLNPVRARATVRGRARTYLELSPLVEGRLDETGSFYGEGWSIKSGLNGEDELSQQAAVFSAPARRRVVVNFHGIGEPPQTVPPDERPFWCPTGEWRRIVEILGAASRAGSAVELTFDDGNLSDVELALPVLVENGLTATFHVCAGRIGQPAYLDEPSLGSLRDAGMAIGSHGWRHVDSRTLSREELVRATRGSQERISAAVGMPVSTFALPLGGYDRRVLEHVRQHYSTVYTSDATSAAPGAWLVPRWSYRRSWTERTVSDLARGVESPRNRWRQRASMTVKRWR